MTSLTPDQRDALPPYVLARENISHVAARISCTRFSPSKARYDYTVKWEELYNGPTDATPDSSISYRVHKSQLISMSPQSVPPSAKEIEAKSTAPKCPADYSDFDDDVAIMSCLSQRSNPCTEPNDCEMILCRAVLIEKDDAGNDFKVKLDSEYPATARLSEVVKDLLTSVENGGKKAKVYVVPRKKGVGLKRLEKKEMDQKMVKNLERHRGNVCLVIDHTAN